MPLGLLSKSNSSKSITPIINVHFVQKLNCDPSDYDFCFRSTARVLLCWLIYAFDVVFVLFFMLILL